MNPVLLIFLSALLLTFSACSSRNRSAQSASKAGGALTERKPSAALTNAPVRAVMPRSEIRGRVTTVNGPGRFAVLKFAVGVMPPRETVLGVYHQGVKAGEIRVTGPQRDTMSVGDILSGECAAGDEVRAD